MNGFEEKYAEYASFFEAALQEFCAEMQFQPPILAESMRYSLLLGGKRVRPVLFFAALDALGYEWKKEKNFAIALECIHTYSLVHDDLPAMDDDDFRRGKPSNHKKFGEANAILAGDALLNTAFSLLFREAGRGENYLYAARCLCEAAGADGMIAGQSADLLYSNSEEGGAEELDFIYKHKTAKLLEAPLIMAATVCGQSPIEWEQFGSCLGKLFQLTDDLLDVKGESASLGKTTGKDERENKLTCVKLFGLDASELQADLLSSRCHAILEGIRGETQFFHAFTDMVRNRNK